MRYFTVPPDTATTSLGDFARTWRRANAFRVGDAEVVPSLACVSDTWHRVQAGEVVTSVPATMQNVAVHADPDHALTDAYRAAVEAPGADVERISADFCDRMNAIRAQAREALAGGSGPSANA
jgi:hypothetical protein